MQEVMIKMRFGGKDWYLSSFPDKGHPMWRPNKSEAVRYVPTTARMAISRMMDEDYIVKFEDVETVKC